MNNNLRIAENKFRQAITLLSNKDTLFFERDAALLLEEAADLGHSNAMFYLAMMYYTGLNSILQNTEKANCLFKKSYELGIMMSLPYLVRYSIIENKPKEIVDKICKLHNMIKEKDEHAAQVMCFALKKFSNEELGITLEKRNLIIKDISIGNFSLDRVPYIHIKDK